MDLNFILLCVIFISILGILISGMLSIWTGELPLCGFWIFLGFVGIIGYTLNNLPTTAKPIDPPVVKVHEKFQGNLQPSQEELRNYYLEKIEQNQRKQESSKSAPIIPIFLWLL